MKESYKYIRFWLLLLAGALCTLVSCSDDEEDNGEPVTVVTGNLNKVTYDSAVCGGEIITGYAKGRGVCWNTSPMPTVENDCTTDGRGAGEFTSILTGLEEGTVYYVRAYALNGMGEYVYGEQKRCVTMAHGKPVTSINDVNTIGTTTAIVVSQMLIDGGVEVSDYGIIYGESADLSLEKGTVVRLDVSKDPAKTSLTGLTDNSEYYVMAYATYAGGTVYSVASSFTTLKFADPMVSLITDNVTGDSFDAVVTATSGTELPILEYGLVYGTNTKPTVETNTVKPFGEGDGTTRLTIDDLAEDTRYYVRPYARNKNGMAYGEEVTVLTLSNKALVSTIATEHITAHRALIGGEILSLGLKSEPITEVGICWDTKTAPTIEGSHVVADASFNNVGQFDALQLFCLLPSTKYYARAYVTNQYGTNYGEEVTFTTREPVANYFKASIETPNFNGFRMMSDSPGEFSVDQAEAFQELGAVLKATSSSRSLIDYRLYIIPDAAGAPRYITTTAYYSSSGKEYSAIWRAKMDMDANFVYTCTHSDVDDVTNSNSTNIQKSAEGKGMGEQLQRSVAFVANDSFVIDWDDELSVTVSASGKNTIFQLIPVQSPEKYKRMNILRFTTTRTYTDWW